MTGRQAGRRKAGSQAGRQECMQADDRLAGRQIGRQTGRQIDWLAGLLLADRQRQAAGRLAEGRLKGRETEG